MICPECQSKNREGAKFCDECGAKLSSPDTLTDLPTLVGDLPDIESSDSGRISVSVPEIEDSPKGNSEDLASGVDSNQPSDDDEDVSACGEGAKQAEACEQADCGPDAENAEQHSIEISSSDDDGEDGTDSQNDYEPLPEILSTVDVDEAEAHAESVLDKWDKFEDAKGLNVDKQQTGELDEEQLRLLSLEASKTSLIENPNVQGKTNSADLTGFDEYLVDSSYVAPAPAYRSGDTMQMPAVSGATPASVSFVAPDPHDKKKAKRDKKAAKAAKKAAEQVSEAASSADSSETTVPQEPKNKKGMSSGAKVGIGVAIFAVLACGIAAGVTYQMEIWGGKVVPNVADMTQTDAAFVLQNKGFTVRTTQVASDSTEGIVLLMDPVAGSRQQEGSEIVLHVSTARVIPDVVGKSQDSAKSLFEDSGFTNVNFVTEKSDETEGNILSVEPASGSKAKAATSIIVKVAESYTVPDTSGMSPDEATKAIESAGLKAKLTYVYDESVSAGSLLGTQPEAGSKVKSGSEVTISVSKSRSAELQSAAYTYLSNAQLEASDGSTFTVSTVDWLTYQGNDSVVFAVTGRASTSVSVLGQTLSVSGDTKQVTGVLQFDSANNVTSVTFK